MKDPSDKELIHDAFHPPYKHLMCDQASLRLLASRLDRALKGLKGLENYGLHQPTCTKLIARLRDEDEECSCGLDNHFKTPMKIIINNAVTQSTPDEAMETILDLLREVYLAAHSKPVNEYVGIASFNLGQIYAIVHPFVRKEE